MTHPERHQRGVALLTMLLVFAVVAALAGDMVHDQYVATLRTQSLLDDSQLRRYAQGGELLARQLLYRDWLADAASGTIADSRREPWALARPPYQPERGEIDVSITDGEAAFNLNSLVGKAGKADPAQRAVLLRLLADLGMDEDKATNLVNAIVDWMDIDQLPRGYDTEDQGYLRDRIPYRTADQAMKHISELRAVLGVDGKLYAALAATVRVLPQPTPVNVNTADPRVLAALMPGLDLAALAAARAEGRVFAKIEDFYRDPATAGVARPKVPVAVDSKYFQIDVSARVGDRRQHWRMLALRNRDNGRLETLLREQRPFWDDDVFARPAPAGAP